MIELIVAKFDRIELIKFIVLLLFIPTHLSGTEISGTKITSQIWFLSGGSESSLLALPSVLCCSLYFWSKASDPPPYLCLVRN